MSKNLQLQQLIDVMESEEVKGLEATYSEGVETIDELLAMLDRVEEREDELMLRLQQARQVKNLIVEKAQELKKKLNARLNQ